ncbi:hypothetical protein [Pollutibacter soli]|uniref:hypothetical protein n=1 Tax=Pollutibacter soli TaxID=3034157 RepID=UPI0030140C15
MKRLTLILCGIIFFFISCQKEFTGPDNATDPPVTPPVTPRTTSYYIRFKLDGAAKEYLIDDTAAISVSPLGNRLDIQGYKSPSDDDYEGIGFAVYFEGTTPPARTYTSDADLIFFAYSPNDPDLIYSAGFKTPPTADTVVITKIGNGEVSGTFKATVYITQTDGNGSVTGVGDEYKKITNGEFKVPMAK